MAIMEAVLREHQETGKDIQELKTSAERIDGMHEGKMEEMHWEIKIFRETVRKGASLRGTERLIHMEREMEDMRRKIKTNREGKKWPKSEGDRETVTNGERRKIYIKR